MKSTSILHSACALVLDDFHVIDAQPILDTLVFLLDRVPPALHLVFLTRMDPPLPLSRLRARNQLVEIRAAQLRFISDEIAVFLNDGWGGMSAPDIAAIEARMRDGLPVYSWRPSRCKQ